MAATDERADGILTYWFGPDYASQPKYYHDPARGGLWFGGGPALDEEIKGKFSHLLPVMASGELDGWLQHPYNGLAGVVLMDQFTRNAYRGDKRAFALDSKCLSWAKELWDSGRGAAFPTIQQHFLLLPFMHSEVLADQELCVQRCTELHGQAEAAVQAGNADAAPAAEFHKSTIGFAIAHRDVIQRWGRFPHRNQVLGRDSTPEEVAGLADGTIRRFG